MPKGSERKFSTSRIVVRTVGAGGSRSSRSDLLATEEPLEIRISGGGQEKSVSITMRTPGNDFELSVGFLYGEGVLNGPDDLDTVRYCDPGSEQQYNVVRVGLRGDMPALAGMERNFFINSACGVCGRASLDELIQLGGPPIGPGPKVSRQTLLSLPTLLNKSQVIFKKTGGLHAAGLFDPEGTLLCLREDVGRHNAMDKLVGWAFMNNHLPLNDKIGVVSGRASYELLQKAVRAGVGMFCAVSAPSSLAVEVAREFGVTLVGFLREESFSIYAGEERVLD